VTGPTANDLYKQLAATTGAAPSWNFHKYLIAPDGKTVHSFGTQVEWSPTRAKSWAGYGPC
jgi:glutathione peroxidase